MIDRPDVEKNCSVILKQGKNNIQRINLEPGQAK
jgi:hypothetical protein